MIYIFSITHTISLSSEKKQFYTGQYSIAISGELCNVRCFPARELVDGIPVFTEDGYRVGESKAAAKKAIPMVVISRILMATPGMGTSTTPLLVFLRKKFTFSLEKCSFKFKFKCVDNVRYLTKSNGTNSHQKMFKSAK